MTCCNGGGGSTLPLPIFWCATAESHLQDGTSHIPPDTTSFPALSSLGPQEKSILSTGTGRVPNLHQQRTGRAEGDMGNGDLAAHMQPARTVVSPVEPWPMPGAHRHRGCTRELSNTRSLNSYICLSIAFTLKRISKAINFIAVLN